MDRLNALGLAVLVAAGAAGAYRTHKRHKEYDVWWDQQLAEGVRENRARRAQEEAAIADSDAKLAEMERECTRTGYTCVVDGHYGCCIRITRTRAPPPPGAAALPESVRPPVWVVDTAERNGTPFPWHECDTRPTPPTASTKTRVYYADPGGVQQMLDARRKDPFR